MCTHTERFRSSLMALISIFLRPIFDALRRHWSCGMGRRFVDGIEDVDGGGFDEVRGDRLRDIGMALAALQGTEAKRRAELECCI